LRRHLAGADWLDAVGIGRSLEHLAEVEDMVLQQCALEMLSAVHSGQHETKYTPQAPRYIRKRVVEMIFAERGRQISLAQISDLVARLEAGRGGNLAGVLATARDGVWTFAPEPPRGSR
jgi:hypothetical protein